MGFNTAHTAWSQGVAKYRAVKKLISWTSKTLMMKRKSKSSKMNMTQ